MASVSRDVSGATTPPRLSVPAALVAKRIGRDMLRSNSHASTTVSRPTRLIPPTQNHRLLRSGASATASEMLLLTYHPDTLERATARSTCSPSKLVVLNNAGSVTARTRA